jgi:hypothetical protein
MRQRVIFSALFVTATLLAFLTISQPAVAAVIDFETDPTTAPSTDDYVLSTPYPIAGGSVQFYFDVNANLAYDSGIDSDPIIEQIGADGNDAFTNNTLALSDIANAPFAPQLGNFFLRQASPGPAPPPFIVDYNTGATITALSGEIWDIDGASQATELWKVEVLDGANNVLTSQFSPLGDSFALDARPWVFSFSGLPSGVDKLRITFQGTKINNIGLAFNNFNPTAVPEPGSIMLLGLGLCALAAIGMRRRRQHWV